MQKKSLLVALFCGALCLTGCLKNEESASVAQVRIAKANELNSIAKLNEAKAAAEAVYAQAELTVANAEAKLREANAALVLAQAETEKVRAELLKVQVALAEVKVDEEKVRLQMLEADLEQKLAEVEAAVAMAEAEKQGWINVLEHAIAAAEAQAITDAQAILEAEQALEAAVLKMEKAQADSAKAASVKYFAALDEVQNLQKEQIETKAMKALVEAGAIEVRDAIHEQIDKIDEKIVEKEALVKYLKKYQTMTPEEAEEALMDARTALNEAYNKYRDAVKAEDDAEKDLKALEAKTADFTHDWNRNFANDVNSMVERAHEEYVPVTVAEGVTRYVKTTGIRVPNKTEKGKTEFVPFWNAEKTYTSWERYPDVDVYGWGDLTLIGNTLIAPAVINYDNIKTALDTAIAHKEKAAADAVADVKKQVEKNIKDYKKNIADNNEEIAIHKKYVDAREAKVTAAEDAYIAEVTKHETYKQKKAEAWDAFQEYMLVKYDISRSVFTARNRADSTFKHSAEARAQALNNLQNKEGTISDLIAEVEPAHVAAEEAIGDYRLAQKEWAEATGSLATKKERLIKAYKDWSPLFEEAKGEPTKVITGNGNPDNDTSWWKGTEDNKIWARAIQKAALNAQLAYDEAVVEYYLADMNFKRNPEGTTYGPQAKARFHAADERLEIVTGQLEDAQEDLGEYEEEYDEAKNAVETALGETIEPIKATNNFRVTYDDYNPDFNVLTYVGFPTVANPDDEYIVKTGLKADNSDWTDAVKEAAGESQLTLMNKVKAVWDAEQAVKPGVASRTGNLAQKYAYYKAEAAEDSTTLAHANIKLIAAIKGVSESQVTEEDLEDIAKYIDTTAETYYRAYKDLEDESDRNNAWDTLQMAYSFNPDEIGELVTHYGNRTDPDDNEYSWISNRSQVNQRYAQFGWLKSSYKVDYKATMVNREGKRVPIAENFYGEEKKPDYTHSLQYQVEEWQKAIDVTEPAKITTEQQKQDRAVKVFKDDVADIITAVNAYKAHETTYNSWITDRKNADKAVNEAKKAVFDAKQVVNDAQAKYDAAEAVANEGMWVYDPDGDLYKRIYKKAKAPVKDPGKYEDKFTFVPIADEIEYLEGKVKALQTGVSALFTIADAAYDQYNNTVDGQKVDIKEIKAAYEALDDYLTASGLPAGSIAELNFTKNVLEQALKYGKVALQIVVDAFDAEIAELDEKIEVYTKIAEIYKAVMNAYLGIVEDGETGPLDGEGEGDDEE